MRAASWPSDWTDPATQRSFWIGFYRQVLAGLGHAGDGMELAEALFAAFSDPAGYRLFDDVRPALEELAGRGVKLGVVSNFEPWLEDVLALQGIDHLFAAVAISGQARGGQARPGDLPLGHPARPGPTPRRPSTSATSRPTTWTRPGRSGSPRC